MGAAQQLWLLCVNHREMSSIGLPKKLETFGNIWQQLTLRAVGNAFPQWGLEIWDAISIPHRPYQKETGATVDYAWRRLLGDMFSSS